MQSKWSDADARKFVSDYAGKGVNEDLALRTYTTRLLGQDPRLVLHGGGNTSVKTTVKDMLGEDVDVICIKGSGWDMGYIEPAGLPAVKLAPLRKLRALDKLSDEDMVNYQRINLLDSGSPNPSVETLLHAFLPHKFIDHVHSTAVLSLVDQPDGEAMAREVYGDKVAYVPYTIPGFALAKSVADVFDKNPGVEGLVLLQHGIFTVGDSAKQAYERMIHFVTLAEERLGRQRKQRAKAKLPANIAALPEIAPILRGAVALEKNASAGTAKRQILNFRTNPAILDLRQRRGDCALYPAGRGDARSHHPHQELAAGGAGAGSRQAGRMEEGRAGGGGRLCRPLSRLFRPQQRQERAEEKGTRSPAAGDPGAGRGPVRRRRLRQGCRHRRRHCREHGGGDHRCRSHRRVQADQRIRHVRSRILVAGTGQAGQVERKGAGPPGGGDHRRRLGHRRRHGQGDGQAGRGSRHSGPRSGCGESRGQGRRRQGAGGGMRRHRSQIGARGLRCRGLGLRRRRYRGLQCRRGLAGHHRPGG